MVGMWVVTQVDPFQHYTGIMPRWLTNILNDAIFLLGILSLILNNYYNNPIKISAILNAVFLALYVIWISYLKQGHMSDIYLKVRKGRLWEDSYLTKYHVESKEQSLFLIQEVLIYVPNC